jgi:geranylgeranyl pyrophosphate synthase
MSKKKQRKKAGPNKYNRGVEMDKFKKLLKLNAKKVSKSIKEFIPREFSSEWLNSVLGKTSWEHDKKACTQAISKPIWELLSRGGKKWRPFLMQLSYKAVGGKNNIEKFMALPELIHNGTLIIDDIEDCSNLRRGKPCIHKLFGINIAINAGNSLYYLPLLLITKDNSLNPVLKVKIYELINKEMVKLSFGQAKDISAILGKANTKQTEALGKFAESIGIAFQIQDDILNITEKGWGKEFGEDITEGKKTLPVIKTLIKANKEDGNTLLTILNSKTKSKEKIEEAISIIKNHKAIDYSKKKAQKLVKEAWKNLNPLIEDSKSKRTLKQLADFLINRQI